MMPLASRGGDHRKEAEVLVMSVTVKLTGAVDSEIRKGETKCGSGSDSDEGYMHRYMTIY